jgi:hypothetical protein
VYLSSTAFNFVLQHFQILKYQVQSVQKTKIQTKEHNIRRNVNICIRNLDTNKQRKIANKIFLKGKYTEKFVTNLSHEDLCILLTVFVLESPYLSIKLYHIYPYLCLLHEYNVIYCIRYYPWFHATAVGPGTHYQRIMEAHLYSE